jgi:hypothetical protein
MIYWFNHKKKRKNEVEDDAWIRSVCVGVVTPLLLSKKKRERAHQSGSLSHILIEMLLVMMGSQNTRSIDICMRDEESQLDFLILQPSI